MEFPSFLAPLLRTIQFVAAVVGLILWAVYLSRLNFTSGSGLHAVLGIFVAGTIWAVTGAGAYAWSRRGQGGNKRRWGMVVGLAIAVAVLDFCFVILFATAAGLTGPSSSASRAHGICYVSNDEDDNDNGQNVNTNTNPHACGEVKGVFGLAILNVCVSQHLSFDFG